MNLPLKWKHIMDGGPVHSISKTSIMLLTQEKPCSPRMRVWPHRLIEMASVGWRGQAWHNLCHFCHFWNWGMKSARAVTFSVPDLIPFSSLVRSIMILATWFSCNVLFWFFLCGLHEIGQKKKIIGKYRLIFTTSCSTYLMPSDPVAASDSDLNSPAPSWFACNCSTGGDGYLLCRRYFQCA